jgi:hypothetical protein
VVPDEDGRAASLELLAPLAPATRYRLLALPPIRDEAGRAPFLPDDPPAFSTGTQLRDAPVAILDAQLDASSGCLVARFATSIPAATTLCIDDSCTTDERRRAGHELALPLRTVGPATIVARDESTAPDGRWGPADVPATSPRPIVITEVLAHPASGGLAQQWVEVHNTGAAPVALGGLELHDERGRNVLPDVTLAPDAWALLVPRGYVAPGPSGPDVAPVPGALIVVLDETHLGGNGVRQTGEALFLAEHDGRVASRASTEGLVLAPGQSASRVTACDVAGAFAPTGHGGATPGGP